LTDDLLIQASVQDDENALRQLSKRYESRVAANGANEETARTKTKTRGNTAANASDRLPDLPSAMDQGQPSPFE